MKMYSNKISHHALRQLLQRYMDTYDRYQLVFIEMNCSLLPQSLRHLCADSTEVFTQGG